MKNLQAEITELRTSFMEAADPETAGVPDFTDAKGMAILETRQIVRELQKSIKALTKPSPRNRSRKLAT